MLPVTMVADLHASQKLIEEELDVGVAQSLAGAHNLMQIGWKIVSLLADYFEIRVTYLPLAKGKGSDQLATHHVVSR